MIQGMIFDINKYSIHDGPGIRTTIFFKGCPGSCRWCHNPESLSPSVEILYRKDRCIECGGCLKACPNKALSITEQGVLTDSSRCRVCGKCVSACPSEARELVGRTVIVDELMDEIEKDILFYDESGGGVTISGGEPLIQPEFLIALLKKCRERNIHTTVDTMGYADPETLCRVAEYTDLFLFDIKHMDSEKHVECVGVPNKIILSNLRMLLENGYAVKVRIPVIPGINDDPENIERMGKFIVSLPAIGGVSILPYHDTATKKYIQFGIDYRMKEIKNSSSMSAEEVAEQLAKYGLDVKIGT